MAFLPGGKQACCSHLNSLSTASTKSAVGPCIFYRVEAEWPFNRLYGWIILLGRVG
jgi:hypothetical protein